MEKFVIFNSRKVLTNIIVSSIQFTEKNYSRKLRSFDSRIQFYLCFYFLFILHSSYAFYKINFKNCGFFLLFLTLQDYYVAQGHNCLVISACSRYFLNACVLRQHIFLSAKNILKCMKVVMSVVVHKICWFKKFVKKLFRDFLAADFIALH